MVRLISSRCSGSSLCHVDVAAAATTPGTLTALDEDVLEPPPSTRRLSAGDLARVVAQMNDEPAENLDDVPTLEAPAPSIPAGIPSPLGDDEPLGDLVEDLDHAFAMLVLPTEPADTPHAPVPEPETPDALRAHRSVVASWTVSAALTLLVTFFATR